MKINRLSIIVLFSSNILSVIKYLLNTLPTILCIDLANFLSHRSSLPRTTKPHYIFIYLLYVIMRIFNSSGKNASGAATVNLSIRIPLMLAF